MREKATYQKKGVTFCLITKKRGLPNQKNGVTFLSVKYKQHYKHNIKAKRPNWAGVCFTSVK